MRPETFSEALYTSSPLRAEEEEEKEAGSMWGMSLGCEAPKPPPFDPAKQAWDPSSCELLPGGRDGVGGPETSFGARGLRPLGYFDPAGCEKYLIFTSAARILQGGRQGGL